MKTQYIHMLSPLHLIELWLLWSISGSYPCQHASKSLEAYYDRLIIHDRQNVNVYSFVEVKGTSKMEPELVIIPSEEEEEAPTRAVPLRDGDGLGAVADALSCNSLGPDSCVRLLWPRHRCPLLRDDVVLVDTPGNYNI